MCNSLKKLIHSDSFVLRHKTAPQHFTRIRCLPFPTLILFLVNFLKQSLQPELDSFFQTLQGALAPVRQVTKGAFSRARLKFKSTAFTELNQHVIEFFEEHFPRRTWHGFRLLAIDGTILRLPNLLEVIRHFGTQPDASSHAGAMARASQLYDYLNRITLHAELHSYRAAERDLALAHGPFLQENDLVLLDRGYPAFWFLAWLSSIPAQFCLRVSPDSWNEVKRFYHSGRSEQIVTISPTGAAKQKCRDDGLPRTPIRVRLIRVELERADDQMLMVSLLDMEAYPLDWFQEVYHFRWGVEENFKHMKSRMEVENFSGKSVESIYQDFHAKVFSMNLTAMWIHPVQDQLDQKSHSKTIRLSGECGLCGFDLKRSHCPLAFSGSTSPPFTKGLDPSDSNGGTRAPPTFLSTQKSLSRPPRFLPVL